MAEQSKVVPPELYPLLDHTINSMFGSYRPLQRFIERRTAESISAGFVRIGDVVQCSEERFFEAVHATPLSRKRLVEALRDLGLEFGMHAPAWRPPASTNQLGPH